MQKTILIGRLGKDVEFRTLDNGTDVATVSVAVSEKYKKGNETVETTEWFNCEFWDAKAKVARDWLKKGHIVYLECKRKTDTWEKDGQKHSREKYIVLGMELLPNNRDEQPSQEKPSVPPSMQSRNQPVYNDDSDDDLPF